MRDGTKAHLEKINKMKLAPLKRMYLLDKANPMHPRLHAELLLLDTLDRQER